MSNIHYEIDAAKKNLYIKRINNEMNDIDKNSERYKELSNIVTILTTPKVDSLNETITLININCVQKKWNYLHNFHKIIKIKEYIKNKYQNYDESFQKRIEEILVTAVEEGNLNSVKLVTYDKDKSIIVDIPCLIINGDKIHLKLPKKCI